MAEDGKKKYKYDIVADQIIEEIRKGRWKIGDKLPPEGGAGSRASGQPGMFKGGTEKAECAGNRKNYAGGRDLCK